MMRALDRKLTGAVSEEEREYEIRHRALARQAGAEGMVLLRNEKKLLPLTAGKSLALYGAGAVRTIKGGTGLGDVNSRPVVSIRQGLENAGFPITTARWLDDYERAYAAAREQWRDEVWTKMDVMEDQGIGAASAYFETPFSVPAGPLPDRESDSEGETDTALYVIARNAGEGADRSLLYRSLHGY
ncbi:glycoside hydrolase family 3 C-terminal domain-containing protein [Lachnoclostridium sp. Marseille-P6806]|uniref:glycoside hydrolase family 3 C-terminal domain-containing protein n=1 Tax=Lachnoclostridium sp. Marseille-P6806 TaxID=2364793 RepID=UPI0010325F01|nr:glycoside hydrolase family 3 C-terminal domain-containing protein [Lachnoclostridium sp. Marseille-P6806]